MPTGEEDITFFPYKTGNWPECFSRGFWELGDRPFSRKKPFGLSVKFTGRFPPCRPAASAEIFRPFFFPSA